MIEVNKIKEEVMKPRKKIIFTTAQNQALPNKKMLENLRLFVKDNNIDEVNIFIVKGKNVLDNKAVIKKQKNWETGDFDLVTINEGFFGPHKGILELEEKGLAGAKVNLVYNTYKAGLKINNNLSIFHNQMLPQVIDPFRGLAPKLPRDKSFIVNATKVRFEVLGSSDATSHRTITSTGAITNDRYNTKFQTGVKAVEMHTFGFTYVEIFNDNKFHLQPILATQRGGFTYLTKKYNSSKISVNKTKALILGDIHRNVMDANAMAESRNMIRLLKPKVVVLHDYHDGSSINHHTAKNFLDRISRRLNEYDSLEDELIIDIKYLKNLSSSFKNTKFLIVESNHDEFIRTYINTRQYLDDDQNILFISKLLPSIVNNPTNKPILQLAIEGIAGKLPKNIVFLRHDEEYRVGGKLISLHGHKGMSGARGTPKTFENSNIKAVTGHSHSPMLYSNGAVTGHLTDLKKQSYARGGVNRWLQANVSIDELNKFNMLILKNNFKGKQ